MSSMSPLFIMFFTTITMVMTVQMTDALGFGPTLNAVTGSVACSLNGNFGVGNASVPPFPNATVHFVCGSGSVGCVLDITTTNSSGSFSIIMDQFTNFVLGDCRIEVRTPLSSCNASLPSTGYLYSHVRKIGPNIVNGILNVTNQFEFIRR
ncbi:uncharacterized protein LOC124926449 [Impatiens glandulifera]|uniref:uncharacterized protein LOC124926449 n=1 Tax=Impatiens glandulifera TaxID=253017 RepID=UPI001FB0F8E4|nr:uncharacterized protein LOC124926449 [Impatiens glandulifera]